MTTKNQFILALLCPAISQPFAFHWTPFGSRYNTIECKNSQDHNNAEGNVYCLKQTN